MLEGLRDIEGSDSVHPPYVSQFDSSASTFLWEDDGGVSHEIIQGRGGRAALFAVGQHRALVAISETLLPHEHFMAFLDEIYVVCLPGRVVHIHTLMRAQLRHHARI